MCLALMLKLDKILSRNLIDRGDKNFINVLDMPGFEILEQNNLEQLFTNALNEQLQCFYNERIFTWELVRIGHFIIPVPED